MTDLEDRIREVLDDEARSAPPPLDAGPAIGRARRRQVRSVAGGALGALAVIAVAVLAVRAVGPGRGTPAADPESTVTTTINGISITHPDGWYVVDPDALSLNGSPEGSGLPRLVLAVSPTEPDELFACPGMVEDVPPTFLMTIQEEPVALAGDASAPWPVPLEPLAIESAGDDPVESGESACYPGWEFLRAGWTAAGRTFEARVGFSPDLAEEDRAALVAAYESLAFEPGDPTSASVVLATGTAGGETWELVAERQGGGLGLTLNGESTGAGGGGFDSTSSELFLLETVFGTDDGAQRVVFGAVPVGTAQVNVRDGDSEGVYEVLDVPDSIDAELDAFVFTTYPEARLEIRALDASGEVLASGAIGTVGGGGDPVETPLPSVVDVAPEHGGRYWAVYLWVGGSPNDPRAEAARDAAEHLGFNPGGGDLACDDGAASALGVPQGWSSVAIYFSTRQDAETAYGWLLDNARAPAPAPAGVAEVTTYCLD